MSGCLARFAKSASEKVYKHFGKNSGNMLLATSILGFTISSLAQIAAIIVNKKYSVSQKAFMVPQELGELFVASSAIFLITKPMQKFASKLVKTGKIMPKSLTQYVKENNLASKRGSLDFDFSKEVKGIIEQIQKSDSYISSKEKELLLEKHHQALNSYETTADAVSALTTTAAGLLTTGLVVPVARNRFASYYQKQNMDVYNNIITRRSTSPSSIKI